MNKPKNQMNTTESGQSLVELAISFTFLLLLLAGAVDFGRAFFTWVTLRDAAQEGAAYASFDPSQVEDTVAHRVYNILELSDTIPDPTTNITVTYTVTPSGVYCLGSTVTVDVAYEQFPISVPFLSSVLGSDTLPIRARIQDTVLRPACP